MGNGVYSLVLILCLACHIDCDMEVVTCVIRTFFFQILVSDEVDRFASGIQAFPL